MIEIPIREESGKEAIYLELDNVGRAHRREDYRQIPLWPMVLACLPFVLSEVGSVALFSGPRFSYLGLSNTMFPFSPLIYPSLQEIVATFCVSPGVKLSVVSLTSLLVLCIVRTIYVSFF